MAQFGALHSSAGPWPRDRWWPLELSEGLKVGSSGGHGPVRYRVSVVAEGFVRFEFSAGMPFAGWHAFSLMPSQNAVEWRHELSLQDKLLTRLLVVPLHDLLLEDRLDTVAGRARGDVSPGRHPIRGDLSMVDGIRRFIARRTGQRPLPKNGRGRQIKLWC